MKPLVLTEVSLQQSSEELDRARARAKKAADWVIIRDCERALTLARLELARQTVRPLKH